MDGIVMTPGMVSFVDSRGILVLLPMDPGMNIVTWSRQWALSHFRREI